MDNGLQLYIKKYLHLTPATNTRMYKHRKERMSVKKSLLLKKGKFMEEDN